MTQAIPLADGVHWVGAIDWNIRDYHGYTLPGTTYNAYLVVGEKTALIDSTYPGFEAQQIDRVASVIDPTTIDYIVLNHIEKDHSGGLPALVRLLPGVPIYCTEVAQRGLARHYDVSGWNFVTAKTGDTLSLGNGKTLAFLEAPMLHWPDSMFTYLVEEQLLFSNDAFSQHIASSARFDDELGIDESMKHAQKFFGNLLVPLAPKVLKKLEQVGALGLQIRAIAPSHGVIWRTNAGGIVEAYANWSQGAAKDKVTIVYDTMHGSTTALAYALAEGLMDEGCEVKVCLLGSTHRSDIVAEVLDSKAVLVGSPTLADTLYPTVADFLSYLNGLQPGRLGRKKLGFAFGSHGGRGGAVKEVSEWMRRAGVEVIGDGIEVTFRPTKEELDRAVGLGRALGRDIRAR